jgi:hypothetical protein
MLIRGEIAEALACLEGTKAIPTEGVIPVHLESYCANVVHELKAKENLNRKFPSSFQK